jgi:S-adenosyl-L-methionine hydrolase (adenosine-forming)
MPGMTLSKSPTPIVLLTDFGTEDAYVGVMKGVMLRLYPTATFVDLTHAIAPQNVRQAAYVLWTAFHYFPSDSVFLVVVDPGVGSSRQPIAIETAQGRYVGPDNGVFGDVLAEVGAHQAIAIDPGLAVPEGLSLTFHGRDLFAPTAARLARGDGLSALGKPLAELVHLPPPRLIVAPDLLDGEVLTVDHFGNVVTSLGRFAWQEDGSLLLRPRLQPNPTLTHYDPTRMIVQVGGHTFEPIRPTYTGVQPGQPLALINSAGQLEIAINQGHAARQLGLAIGDPVSVRLNA